MPACKHIDLVGALVLALKRLSFSWVCLLLRRWTHLLDHHTLLRLGVDHCLSLSSTAELPEFDNRQSGTSVTPEINLRIAAATPRTISDIKRFVFTTSARLRRIAFLVSTALLRRTCSSTLTVRSLASFSAIRPGGQQTIRLPHSNRASSYIHPELRAKHSSSC